MEHLYDIRDEIPYLNRILPKLLEDIIRARNTSTPQEYRRTVDTVMLFLPMMDTHELKKVLYRFMHQTIKPGFDGGGYFEQNFQQRKAALQEQFEAGEIDVGKRITLETDYLFAYIFYLLEKAGLVTPTVSEGYDIDDIS